MGSPVFKKGRKQVKEETFYLVREDVLPDAMRKTLEVKKLLDRKKADSVADAVQKKGFKPQCFL
ncbi:hypothetical protein BsIDN1_48370 [Bacillus safensis]|uniref:Uncharacterized protein n=1 Tax=Bacillus safensis TaxID=561879 RepID=A0A5S9MHC8_BACIA|nr:hypothetical protein BsIDN1_48370 [Bacillus safensis]